MCVCVEGAPPCVCVLRVRHTCMSTIQLYVTQYLRSKEKDRVRAQYYSPPPPHHMSPPFPPNLPDFPGMIGTHTGVF